MADSFLDNAGGWTPVPDKLVREYGFEVAYVWGKVWRYCQMQNGACTASHETIAKRAGMSRRTLIDKLNILIEAGYIEDLTPDLKNKPHTYCTTKGEAKITSTVQISHTDITTSASDTDVDMRILHSDDAEIAQPDPSTMQNLHTQDAEIAQPTMQDLHLKKDSKKHLKETTTKERAPAPIPAYKVFIEVTEYHAITKHWRNELARIVGDDPEDLEFFRKVCIGWTGKYPSKHNVEGMLDYYKRREIPGQQKNGVSGGHYSTSQNNTGYDPALEGGGLTGSPKEIATAFDRIRRRSRGRP